MRLLVGLQGLCLIGDNANYNRKWMSHWQLIHGQNLPELMNSLFYNIRNHCAQEPVSSRPFKLFLQQMFDTF